MQYSCQGQRVDLLGNNDAKEACLHPEAFCETYLQVFMKFSKITSS